MDGVAKFRQPATAWDMASNLLGEGLSRSFAQALPDPAGASSFSRQAANAGRAGLSAASQRLLRLSLNDFLKTQTRNVPYASAIGRVQSGAVTGLPFRHDEAVAIRNMADRIAADRQKIRVAMNDNAPGLVMKASRTEQIAAHNAVQILRQRASAEQMPGIARRVEGSLGDFEYHFPAQARSAAQAAQAGGLTELAQATATGVEMAANGPSPRTSGRSSRSFRMMRASFRAGGVVIGADPVALDRLDYEMLEWQREGSRLRLAIIDGAGTRIELGSYGGAMIQQALAYAADGRPMTVTMTDSPLTMGLLPTDEGLRPSMILKVHLHPALVNTELGCRLIELDRFTDEATGRWEERAKWQQAVKLQLMFYRAAAYNELDGFMQSFVKSGMNASSFVTTAFAPLNNVDDPRQSIFAAHPRRFDPGLSRMLKKCSADPASFVTCASNFPYDPMNYPVPEAWEVWSGVRERDFELRRTSFPAIVDPAGSPHPLRFMLQVAFNDSAPADENCAPGQCASDAESPWEFPMIAGELDRRVRDNVKASASDSAILAEAAEFTVLQRLFRAALKGELGPRFERAGLIKLMKDAAAAEPITYSPTPQWSQGRLGAELMALAAERAPERVADYYDTPAEAEAARAYLAALLAPGAGAKFADEARCR
jgi:hypothetical protein